MELKGNPNFQGILNWIIQILHYYCRKQHKNIENSRIIEQNVAISLYSSLCLAATCASFAFLNGRVFSVLRHSFERHKWPFVLYIVSFSALKMTFSKLSLVIYRCLHKNTIHILCLQLLQNVFTNLSLLYLLHKSFSSWIKAVLHGKICMTQSPHTNLKR